MLSVIVHWVALLIACAIYVEETSPQFYGGLAMIMMLIYVIDRVEYLEFRFNGSIR